MANSGILSNKVVVVTGGGRGIGREVALLSAREGAAVIVNDLGGTLAGDGQDTTPAEEVVELITSGGGNAYANFANVAEFETAKTIIDDAIKHFGRIDAVVNNAGISRDTIFHKMTPENWHSVINVHLNGSFNVSRAAATHFREQNSGSFVHMTSTSGLIGNIGQSNYSSAKMALVGLSNSIALDMGRYGVRSNCVSPFAWSRMTDSIQTRSEGDKERVKQLQSMTPDKVAPMVTFLCSDSAAEVSGEVFCVRKNEILLFSKMRPVRSIHRQNGWTPESISNELLPALKPNLHPLQVSTDIFEWDPI
ncbi:MAG: SDR family oxidoreductase [Halieaceae bacterium]|nr:SDR family oxidoreductase [Halieaceae bacterium]